MSTKSKEEIIKEGMKVWEEDQKTNPHIVNPHAFAYGYLYGVKNKEQEAIECLQFAMNNERLITDSGDANKIYELFLKSKQ